MTTYTWNGTPGTSSDWNTPANWLGGVVPDTADANVIFPTITYAGDGTVAPYHVSIAAGETITIGALSLAADLTIAGALDVAGAAALAAGGTIDLTGGTMRLGSVNVTAGSGILGSGTLASAGTITNAGVIGGTALLVTAAGFDNLGTLEQGVQISLNGGAGSFANLSGGTLSGGSITDYGTLVLPADAGGIVAIASSVSLSGTGTVLTVGPTGTVSLLSTLQTIAAGGTLTLDTGTFTAASALRTIAVGGSLSLNDAAFSTASVLQVEGQLALNRLSGGSTLTTAGLVVGATGVVSGAGTIIGPVSGTGTLSANGRSSSLVVGSTGSVALQVSDGTLELTGPGSGTATFTNLGPFNTIGVPPVDEVLQLDDAADFTGTIEGLQNRFTTAGRYSFDNVNVVPDEVVLPGVALTDVTRETYTGTAQGGTLTLQTASRTLALRFAGPHQVSDFMLETGPQIYSNSPSSLVIESSTIELNSAQPNIITTQGTLAYPLFSTQSGSVVSLAIAGDQTVTLLGTQETVTIGVNRATAVAYGPYNDVVLGPKGGSTITLGDGYQIVVLSGAGNIVAIGNAGTVAGLAGALSYVNAGTGGEIVTAGNGTNVINTGGYGDVINVGSGLNLIFATDGSTTTLDPLLGPAGHTTLTLGSGDNFAYLHGAANRIVEGGGLDAVWGGIGGGDSFVLAPAGGALFMENFAAGDTLDLTKILAGVPLAADLSNIGNFVSVVGYGADDSVFGVNDGGSKTVLQVLGAAGTHYVSLENVGSLTVAALLAQSALVLPGH